MPSGLVRPAEDHGRSSIMPLYRYPFCLSASTHARPPGGLQGRRVAGSQGRIDGRGAEDGVVTQFWTITCLKKAIINHGSWGRDGFLPQMFHASAFPLLISGNRLINSLFD